MIWPHTLAVCTTCQPWRLVFCFVAVLGDADSMNDFSKEGRKAWREAESQLINEVANCAPRCPVLKNFISKFPSLLESVSGKHWWKASGWKRREGEASLSHPLSQKLPWSCCVSMGFLAPPGEALDSVFSTVGCWLLAVEQIPPSAFQPRGGSDFVLLLICLL